jgi:hypothetical protein
MNVWIRIYSVVESSRDGLGLVPAGESYLCVVIHGSESAARETVAKYGGIALEVEAESLQGITEFGNRLSALGPNHCVTPDDVMPLHESDYEGSERHCTRAYMSVACDGIPHRMLFVDRVTEDEFETLPVGARDSDYFSVMDFTPESEAFLDALAVAVDTPAGVL